MSFQAQRSRPEQIERIVSRLAEDVHNAVGGRAFPAKLIQTAVTVLSNDKAVSSEKWERVGVRHACSSGCSRIFWHTMNLLSRTCKQREVGFHTQQQMELSLSRECKS